MARLNLPLPPRLSSVPAIDRDALAWAALFKDQLESWTRSLAPVSVPASGGLTLTTADQDVPGCTASLAPGLYVLLGVFDFAHTLNGGGVAVGKLNVGGTLQAAQALLLNTGSANGDRATVVQVWVFRALSSLTAKLQATKTINAGTALANITHTTMTYMAIG